MRTRLIAFTLAAAGLLPASAGIPKGSTLDNLQAAFNGERNAQAKYEGYARKADAEGYLGAGAIFRAAAKAEGIHAQAHASVIRKLGAAPKAEVQPPAPKGTRENLEDALKGETYEMDRMYPGFITTAEAEGRADALQSFTYARTAEVEHAKLYAGAVQDLAAWKGARSFSVCSVCGFTTGTPGLDACPSCGNPGAVFILVK